MAHDLVAVAAGRDDVLHHGLRLRRQTHVHEIRPHAQEGEGPGGTPLAVGDHLGLVDDRQIVFGLEVQHLDRGGLHAGERDADLLLAGLQAAGTAVLVQFFEFLIRQQTQRRQVDTLFRLLQHVQGVVALAAVRRADMQDKLPLLLPGQGEQVRIGLGHGVQQAVLDAVALPFLPQIPFRSVLQQGVLQQQVRDRLLRERPADAQRVILHESLISRRLFLDQVLRVQSRLVVDPPQQPQSSAHVFVLIRHEVQQIVLRRIAVEQDGAGHAVGQRPLLRDPRQITAHPGGLYRPGLSRHETDEILPQRLADRFVQHAAAAHGSFRDLAGGQQIFTGAFQLVFRAFFLLRGLRGLVLLLPRLLRVRLQADVFLQQTFRLFVFFVQIFVHTSILLYLLHASPEGCKIN